MTAPIDPELLAEAVAMRAAGYTVAVISKATGIDRSTLKRALSDVKLGSAKKERVEHFENDLIDSFANVERVKTRIASLIQEDVTLAQAIREKVCETLESIDTKNSQLAARSLAACATAVKVSSDTVRNHFRDGKPPIEPPPRSRTAEEMMEFDRKFNEQIDEVLKSLVK